MQNCVRDWNFEYEYVFLHDHFLGAQTFKYSNTVMNPSNTNLWIYVELNYLIHKISAHLHYIIHLYPF